jgi:hypothetical protein
MIVRIVHGPDAFGTIFFGSDFQTEVDSCGLIVKEPITLD